MNKLEAPKKDITSNTVHIINANLTSFTFLYYSFTTVVLFISDCRFCLGGYHSFARAVRLSITRVTHRPPRLLRVCLHVGLSDCSVSPAPAIPHTLASRHFRVTTDSSVQISQRS